MTTVQRSTTAGIGTAPIALIAVALGALALVATAVGLVLAGGSYEPALPGLPDPGATVGWGAPVTRLLAPSLRRMIDRVPQGRSRIVVAQRCIVEALRKGDAAEAESWMTRHVQDFRRGYEIAGIALDTRAA